MPVAASRDAGVATATPLGVVGVEATEAWQKAQRDYEKRHLPKNCYKLQSWILA